MRPTLRRLPWPAIPVTSVPSISGATITLIKRRKMSLNTRRCSASCGRSSPISPPSSMEKKSKKVSERPRKPAAAIKTSPAQRRMEFQTWGPSKTASAAPNKNNRTPVMVSVRNTLKRGSGAETFETGLLILNPFERHFRVPPVKSSLRLTLSSKCCWAFRPSVIVAKMPSIKNLECSRCKALASAERPQTVCAKCQGAFYVRYDLEQLHGPAARELLVTQDPASLWSGMWRYRAVLPTVEPVTLGEGWTPMLRSRRHPGIFLKEEGANPTGTFKARGLALAVTMARHYGLRKLAVPSAGNAAGALAAYAAAAGIEAHIFMPLDVPFANYVEAVAYGAHVELVNGLISDCARIVQERKQQEGWFDISTLKEPFRVEGKKTMGYEIVEQLGWEYPDAVIYPAGGGVGLIGMWKAFAELEEMGWVAPGKRPKMIAVQSSGCAPVVRAFEN